MRRAGASGYTAQIPASIPAVIYSTAAGEKLGFILFTGEQTTAAPTESRLVDAVRRKAKTTGKEVKTVLIIDDEPALLELLAKTLLFKGFQVLPAGTGRRGI